MAYINDYRTPSINSIGREFKLDQKNPESTNHLFNLPKDIKLNSRITQNEPMPVSSRSKFESSKAYLDKHANLKLKSNLFPKFFIADDVIRKDVDKLFEKFSAKFSQQEEINLNKKSQIEKKIRELKKDNIQRLKYLQKFSLFDHIIIKIINILKYYIPSINIPVKYERYFSLSRKYKYCEQEIRNLETQLKLEALAADKYYRYDDVLSYFKKRIISDLIQVIKFLNTVELEKFDQTNNVNQLTPSQNYIFSNVMQKYRDKLETGQNADLNTELINLYKERILPKIEDILNSFFDDYIINTDLSIITSKINESLNELFQ